MLTNRVSRRLAGIVVSGALTMATFISQQHLSIDSLRATATTATSEFRIHPDLNPVIIGECDVGLGDTLIDTYISDKFGAIHLLCGDSKSGYVHIRSNHEGDWQNVLNKVQGGGNWDDLINWASKQAVQDPESGMPTGRGSGKWCYAQKITIKGNGNGLKYTFYATTIVSASNKKVITSYPTGKNHNCGEV